MTCDYLLVGQGISGTWLSYWLQQEGASFVVIDSRDPIAPSRLAAGVINPVTGRRYSTTWMADTLIPFAREAYAEMGNSLGIKAISQRNIIDFFPTAQMRLSFQEQVNGTPYLELPGQEADHSGSFRYELGYGEILPAYTAHLETILPVWQAHLQQRGLLRLEELDQAALEIRAGNVVYRDITARKIIFCDGIHPHMLPHFDLLPFAPNKGEALVVDIPGLPEGNIYKHGMMLVPLATPGRWWLGSGFAWNAPDLLPTAAFREKAEELLRNWLRLPYTVVEHRAGNRPATVERRPFVGLHPLHPSLGILNGMGTKGCSLSPYFARQLARHLLYGEAITPEVDIRRFSRLLSR